MKLFGTLLLLSIVVIGGGVFAYQSGVFTKADTQEETTSQNEDTQSQKSSNVQIDVQAALKARILGDVNAPIRISEHASFTCGHCAAFHKNSFKAVKEELIDTGKAYMVFSDFPLNAPALHASVLARCVAEDRYFEFVDMLFETQEEWAFERNYIKFLQAKAQAFGLDNDTIRACLENDELQKGILSAMNAARVQFGISATPSFVVNNKKTISGALPPEDFIKQVNEAVR